MSVVMIDRRAVLAETATNLLLRDDRVKTAVPYGSLSEGRGDRYSDIDLRVEVRGVSDRAFAEYAPAVLGAIGPYLIETWGPTALPDRFIRSLYFADYPLFWHVDVWCEGALHGDGSDLKAAYHWPFMFRVWVDDLKNVLRGAQGTATLDRFAEGSMDLHALPRDQWARLSAHLDRVHERALSKGAPCGHMFSRCDALRKEFLSSGTVTV